MVKENVSLGSTTVPFKVFEVISRFFCLFLSLEYILVENLEITVSILCEVVFVVFVTTLVVGVFIVLLDTVLF